MIEPVEHSPSVRVALRVIYLGRIVETEVGLAPRRFHRSPTFSPVNVSSSEELAELPSLVDSQRAIPAGGIIFS